MFVNYDKLDLQGNPLVKKKAAAEVDEEAKEEVSAFADAAGQEEPKAYAPGANDSSDFTDEEDDGTGAN